MTSAMKISFFLLPALISLWLGAVPLRADTLYLKNGREVEGIVREEAGGSVILEVNAGSVKFLSREIERIERSDSEQQGRLRADWEKEKQDNQERFLKLQKEEELRPKRLDFTKDSRGIRLIAKLNGKVEANLVMDTGSTLVVLRKGLADELGIDLNQVSPGAKLMLADGREAEAKYITLASVRVEGVEAENVEAAVMLDDPEDTGFGDGLLGMSFLRRFNFKVDYRQEKLILEKL